MLTARDACERCLAAYRDDKGRWGGLPEEINLAARVWLEIAERPERVSGHYVSVITARLRLFLGLTAERQQRVVQAGRTGILWRGETLEFLQDGEPVWHFEQVIAEYQRMRELSVARYRDEVALKKADRLLGAEWVKHAGG